MIKRVFNSLFAILFVTGCDSAVHDPSEQPDPPAPSKVVDKASERTVNEPKLARLERELSLFEAKWQLSLQTASEQLKALNDLRRPWEESAITGLPQEARTELDSIRERVSDAVRQGDVKLLAKLYRQRGDVFRKSLEGKALQEYLEFEEQDAAIRISRKQLDDYAAGKKELNHEIARLKLQLDGSSK